MKGAPHPEKLRRSVSRPKTIQAIVEIATDLQAGKDDMVLCFSFQNHVPVSLSALRHV